MENQQIKTKPQRSTILLILFFLFLFNAGHLFRTSINTMYFTEDVSGDYVPVEATVIRFKPVVTEKIKNSAEELKLMPIFSFLFEEEKMTREAPSFTFKEARTKTQPYQLGEKYSLWIHKRWGTFMVPPVMAPAELGRSQLCISLLFLLLAIGLWILRSKLVVKK